MKLNIHKGNKQNFVQEYLLLIRNCLFQEIQSLDNKIHETVETINTMKTHREFYLSFAKDPQLFINKWLISQSRDLKTMTDVAGNPEEERHTDFYYQPWAQEAVCRYFYSKIQQKRQELDSALGVRNG